MQVTPANALTQWARVLLASLADGGVTDVVISPGSRSTPFVAAAVNEPRLRCHDVIDERAGGFFALGQGRLTGRPSVLLCTSGTAATHYYPAVVEAGLAGVPLIVVTADRPLELQDCSAPQTIDQLKLFGGHVRRFYELGTPDPAAAALAGLRRLALQAVHHSRWPLGGAVHLNVRARKPLEPRAPASAQEQRLQEQVDRLLRRPPTRARPPLAVPDPAAVAEVAALCQGSRAGVVVAGPAPPAAATWRPSVFALARRLGFPLLAEATSQLRVTPVPPGVPICEPFDLVLRATPFATTHRPEVILQLGAPPTSSAWERFLATCRGTKIVLAGSGWPDPPGDADVLLLGDPQLAVEALCDALPGTGSAARGWADAFVAAGEAAWAATNDLLARDDRGLREGHVVRAVLEAIPAQSALLVGNSLPVRALDQYGRGTGADVVVLSQRGASGIDGLVAGAAGTASVTGHPVTLLLGDVSLLHDLGSLAVAAAAPVPLVIVTVHNAGGRIFEQLPVARAHAAGDLPPGLLDHILTPHHTRFDGAATMFGLAYRRATTQAELRAALAGAYSGPGCLLVEAVVPPHGAVEDLALLTESVTAALA